jgi:DNA-binding MarR family transcriptional regulator
MLASPVRYADGVVNHLWSEKIAWHSDPLDSLCGLGDGRGHNGILHKMSSDHVDHLVQLLKLSSLINGPMQDGVADPGQISLNELKIMMCLGGEGALAGHDITEIMAIPPMNVSRALANLRQRGWIEPVVDGANRRRKPVQLSAAGWNAYAAMLPDVAGVSDYLLSALTQSELKSFANAVGKIIARLEDWFEEHHAGTHLMQASKMETERV